jgi:hypothetical protein
MYLKDVAQGWGDFWRIRFNIGQNFVDPTGPRVVYGIWKAERWVIMGLVFVGMILGAYASFQAVRRRLRGELGLPLPVVLLTTILCSSIIQALAEYGENSRYAIPTQSLVLLMLIVCLADWRSGRQPVFNRLAQTAR